MGTNTRRERGTDRPSDGLGDGSRLSWALGYGLVVGKQEAKMKALISCE